jgi:hypothetical protein
MLVAVAAAVAALLSPLPPHAEITAAMGTRTKTARIRRIVPRA